MTLSPLRRFRQDCHIFPTALIVRVQRFRNDLYKAVKGSSTIPVHSPLDDRWVILTTSNAFHYFRARRDEIGFALVFRQDHRRRRGERFL